MQKHETARVAALLAMLAPRVNYGGKGFLRLWLDGGRHRVRLQLDQAGIDDT